MSENRIASLPVQMTSIQTKDRPLAAGQIVEGKVVKLYPNQKALIQIGSREMVAQLEAPLASGNRYHFQVNIADDVLYLKVLNEQNGKDAEQSVAQLLNKLGIPSSKQALAFVRALIQENIPFQKEQLKQALDILTKAENTPEAAKLLKNMIATKTPITPDIFQALFTKQTKGLQDVMSQVLQDLTRTASGEKVVPQGNVSKPLANGIWEKIQSKAAQVILNNNLSSERNTPIQTASNSVMTASEKTTVDKAIAIIGKMTDRTQFSADLLMKQLSSSLIENESVFQAFKSAGIVPTNTSFTAWQKAWTGFIQENMAQATSPATLPFNISLQTAAGKLEAWHANQTAQQTVVTSILENNANALQAAVAKNEPLPQREFAAMARQIERLIPTLTSDQATALRAQLQNQPEALQNLLQTLEKFAAQKQSFPAIEHIQAKLQQEQLFALPEPKTQFLAHVKQVMEEAGIAHERNIIQGDLKQAAQDLKSQLLTLDKSNAGGASEAGKQLVHLINGVQLQSTNMSEHVIQASLQLPGGALGLSGDARIDFEGKRESDGAINPEFCRILFYLDLEHLDETMIDMNVHKGNVSLTVYNDHPQTRMYSKTMEPLLKSGLQSIDYRLASITVKPFAEKQVQPAISNAASQASSDHAYRRVDYRI